MTTTRFLLVEGVSGARGRWPRAWREAGGEVADDGSWVAWRAVAANNRELGRSLSVYPDAEACTTAVRLLCESAVDLVGQPALDAVAGLWTWRARLGEEVVAASSRAYHRRREAVYNLEQFCAGLASAQLPDCAAAQRT